MADSTTAHRSLIGTENYRTPEGKRPESYRELVSHLWPNGQIPVVGMTPKMKSKKVDDPLFHWFEKIYPRRSGTVETLEDAGGTEISSNGSNGDEWRVIVKTDVSQHFRSGQQALLTIKEDSATDFAEHTIAKVLSVQDLGDNSVITIRLLEDDNGIGVHYNSNKDDIEITVSGSINAEGAQMPDTVSYAEKRLTNRTQIFRYPLLRTRTALRTRLRTGDDYREAKREALELHYADIEMAFWFGIQTENSDNASGQPEGTTRGIVRSINAYSPSENIIDFDDQTVSWASGGRKWLDEALEVLFRWGGERKMGVCGRKALLGIQELVHTSQIAQYNIQRTTNEFGMDILRWYGPFGTLDLRTHALFTRNKLMSNSIVVLEPENFEYRYIDDTFYCKDPNANNYRQGGPVRVDGLAEEYVTECGLAHKHMESMGILHSVGVDQD